MTMCCKKKFSEMLAWRLKTTKWVLVGLPVLLLAVIIGIWLKKDNGPVDKGYDIYKDVQGQYYAYESGSDNDIFSGRVNVVYAKTRTGSFHSNILIIHDENHHGFMCSGIKDDGEFYYLCRPVGIIPDVVTAQDTAYDVTAELNSTKKIAIVVRLKPSKSGLTLVGHPWTSECGSDPACDNVLSVLANSKETADKLKLIYQEIMAADSQ